MMAVGFLSIVAIMGVVGLALLITGIALLCNRNKTSGKKVAGIVCTVFGGILFALILLLGAFWVMSTM